MLKIVWLAKTKSFNIISGIINKIKKFKYYKQYDKKNWAIFR